MNPIFTNASQRHTAAPSQQSRDRTKVQLECVFATLSHNAYPSIKTVARKPLVRRPLEHHKRRRKDHDLLQARSLAVVPRPRHQQSSHQQLSIHSGQRLKYTDRATMADHQSPQSSRPVFTNPWKAPASSKGSQAVPDGRIAHTLTACTRCRQVSSGGHKKHEKWH